LPPTTSALCSACCLQFNDQILQLFTSSLFLAGAFAALVGMVTCKKYGRRFTMIMGGLAFIIGESTSFTSRRH
jgi:MFS family permease